MNSILKIGVFGAGNMAEALLTSINKDFPDIKFFIYTPTHIKAEKLAKNVSGTTIYELNKFPIDCDLYFLLFKPQNLTEFNFKFKEDSNIVSFLAAVSLTKLQTKFKAKNLVRVMPNTPSLINAGANLFYFDPYFNEQLQDQVKNIFKSCGLVFQLNSEKKLDEATVFSGSGPAFVFKLAEIFYNELKEILGDEQMSSEIVKKTFLGSVLLMNHESSKNLSLKELTDQVTSKKGVTYEALKVLEEQKISDIFKKSFIKATNRIIELNNEVKDFMNALLDMIPKNIKDNLFVKAFGFFKVPLIFFVGPKVIRMDDEVCEIKIPLNRRTKNHLNSMYFGVLATGADIAGGLVAMNEIVKSKEKIALSFKDFNAQFLKRAEGDVHFKCTEVFNLKKFVEDVIKSKERMNYPVKVVAFVPSIDQSPVAEFTLTLSLKLK